MPVSRILTDPIIILYNRNEQIKRTIIFGNSAQSVRSENDCTVRSWTDRDHDRTAESMIVRLIKDCTATMILLPIAIMIRKLLHRTIVDWSRSWSYCWINDCTAYQRLYCDHDRTAINDRTATMILLPIAIMIRKLLHRTIVDWSRSWSGTNIAIAWFFFGMSLFWGFEFNRFLH